MTEEIATAKDFLNKREIKIRVYNEALNQLSRLEIDCEAMEALALGEPEDKAMQEDYEKTKKRVKTWAKIVEVAKKQILETADGGDKE